MQPNKLAISLFSIRVKFMIVSPSYPPLPVNLQTRLTLVGRKSISSAGLVPGNTLEMVINCYTLSLLNIAKLLTYIFIQLLSSCLRPYVNRTRHKATMRIDPFNIFFPICAVISLIFFYYLCLEFNMNLHLSY